VSAPLFLVDAARLAADHVVLDGPEGRHAATVRRIRPGERVDLADGSGLVCEFVVAAAGRDVLELVVRRRYELPQPQPRLVVVQALPKGDRGELAVELMTECGADVIVPWAAARCVPRWDGPRGAKALDRWRSHAREAAKQARRPRVPEVCPLADTSQVLARAARAALAVVLEAGAAQPLAALDVPASGEVLLVVGPEGGLTPEELAGFAGVGAVRARLGPEVLRTSTAGAAALAVLSSRTARWA